jgi:hypothetical protein
VLSASSAAAKQPLRAESRNRAQDQGVGNCSPSTALRSIAVRSGGPFTINARFIGTLCCSFLFALNRRQ